MSTTNGTTSHQPDLDWSQLKETVLMLNLAVTQIDQSMHDGNQSVDTLASSFTDLASLMAGLSKDIEDMPDGELKDRMSFSTAQASSNVHAAIIAFQFYDKLSQRLNHVSNDLEALTQLISNPSTLYAPPAWKALQDKIREKYTMEEERTMFDQVLSGVSITEALAEYKQAMDAKNNQDDDIELF